MHSSVFRSMAPKFVYPQIRRSSFQETLHGVSVADPYRWLEDPHSEETQQFVANQQTLWRDYSGKLPLKTKFQKRLAELYDHEKFSVPFHRGERYFHYYNTGLQNQSAILVQKSLEGESTLFFDPNTLAEDGTAALGATSFSKGYETTGKFFFAYGVSRSGSDWQTIHVKNVETGETLKDKVEWMKFSSISWTHDDLGFFYSRYPAPKSVAQTSDESGERGEEVDSNLHHQVFYHLLGTEQKADRLVYENKEIPHYNHGAVVTDDGKYLIIKSVDGCKNANTVFVAELGDNWTSWLKDEQSGPYHFSKVVDTMDFKYVYVANNNDDFYFLTNNGAPRNRLVRQNWKEPAELVEIVRQPPKNSVLNSVDVVHNNVFVVTYLEDVKNVVRLYSFDGTLYGELPLPSVGTAQVECQRKDSVLFFKFVSFVIAGDVYKVDFSHWAPGQPIPTPELFRRTSLPGFDADQLVAKQVFYISKDGTRIPMFIVHQKNITLDGSNPTYLYGYGGFDIALSPTFSSMRLAFLQHLRGILAVANLRGGGEYGEEWHQQGTFGNKQNVFDDFQAAAEYLISEKYTKSEKLAIHGGSNGGLLVAACANQRPDLYAAAVAAVGVLDMLRFHKFTIGHAWRTDYGDPDKEEDFKYIQKYSPLHNVPTSGKYPGFLITTADHDDRVVPLHSFKFIAELQHKLGSTTGQETPLLIRIESKAGHGAGKPTTKILEEYADVFSFIAQQTGAKWVD